MLQEPFNHLDRAHELGHNILTSLALLDDPLGERLAIAFTNDGLFFSELPHLPQDIQKLGKELRALLPEGPWPETIPPMDELDHSSIGRKFLHLMAEVDKEYYVLHRPQR